MSRLLKIQYIKKVTSEKLENHILNHALATVAAYPKVDAHTNTL